VIEELPDWANTRRHNRQRGVPGNRGLDYTREIGSEARARTVDTTETASITATNQSVAINPETTYLTISGSGSLSKLTGVTRIGHQITIVWGAGCTATLDDQTSSNFDLRTTWASSAVGTVAVLVWNGTEWLELSRSIK